MNIAVDLRSLQSGTVSGVENYILNTLEHLIPLDTKNTYTLFYNSLGPINIGHLHYVNTQVARTRIPNKILNTSLRLFNYPKFENLLGKFDCLFLPNFNQVSLAPSHRLIITVHDLSPFIAPEFYDVKRKLWHRMLKARELLNRADLVFAVSEFTKQDLMSQFEVKEQKIVVTPLGIDADNFTADIPEARLRDLRNRYNLPGDFILFLGILEPRKNVSGLIDAFERIREPVFLVIAGKLGWKYNQILRRIKASRKRNFIRYLGYVSEPDKPALLKLARVFVWPSFYEGFGLPPLEAMAVGTPVITSKITSLPEVVGSAGLLIDPYNSNELTNALDQSLSQGELRQRLISKGLKQSAKFRWQNTAQLMLNAINTRIL